MSETDITESAKKIADAVMRGEYGSVVSDEGLEGPEGESYAGWDKLKSMNKKQIMIISGVVLGVVLVSGAAAGGFYYWKKHRSPSA
jgi:hypothetical protein